MPAGGGGGPGVLVLSLLTAACSTSPPAPLQSQSVSLADDQSLRVRLPAAPRSLDPALATDEREEAVLRQFSEPLLKPAPDLRDVQGAAAESYEISPDGLTWTFHLRANDRYADGEAVRATDFVYSWRRLLDPRTEAPRGALFAPYVKGGVELGALPPRNADAAVEAALNNLGLKAVDDLTLQITTPQPAGGLRWIATLPEGGPLRPEMLKAPGTTGNGPFHISESSSSRIVMAPNPDYWGGRPTLNKLEFDFTDSDSAAITLFQSQQLGEVAAAPRSVPAALRRDLHQSPELTSFWLDFNTEKAPFDNARVRQAFAEAIDRPALAADVFHGRAAPVTTLVPAGMRGYHPENGQPQQGDLTAAKAALDQSGVSHDQLNQLTLITRDGPSEKDLASAVAAQLNRAFGLNLSVQPLPAADYAKRLHAGDFTLAGPEGWTADYPDEQDFFDLFRSIDGNNGARWRNPRYDQLVKLADTEINLDKRDQLYNQAEQLLVQESPVAFLVQRYDASLVQPYVRGLRQTAVDEWPGAAYSTLIYLAAH